ncbi:MAG TPA: DegV family protein [Bacilli bacterium]|nr:DegV family protein [Bacilli bacterium]
MSKIAIITDSTAYLPPDTIHTHNITVIPLMVNFGQESYKEGVDIIAEQFYPRLKTAQALPTTSQPAVGEVVQAYERLLENHDAVIGLFLSGGLSGTAASAETAARIVGGDKITVIDSQFTSWGLSEMVLTACKMVEAGKSKDEIVEHLLKMRDEIEAFFVVDSLEHLHRGGRIGGVSAALGTLLQVKPILTLHGAVGKLELKEKIRTRKKALARVIELLKDRRDPARELRMSVVYTDNPEDGKAFQEQLRGEFPDAHIDLSELGPVIGTHVGPGLLAVLFYNR